MARYPTFEDWRNEPREGIRRCNELLLRSPNDVQLLVPKLRLLYEAKDTEGASEVLTQISTIQPAVTDLSVLVDIESAAAEAEVRIYPQPSKPALDTAKVWDHAVKGSTDHRTKRQILSYWFGRAIVANRLGNAQQALIRLKALDPESQEFYMGHAAVTQLLSTSKDDLHSRLALSLARRALEKALTTAVTNPSDDVRVIDWRVPGQIFTIQGSQEDLAKSLGNRALIEGKHVFDTHPKEQDNLGGVSKAQQTSASPATVTPKDWLSAEVTMLKQHFKALVDLDAAVQPIETFAANAIRLFYVATSKLRLERYRPTTDCCFLAISALVKVWVDTSRLSDLLQASFLAEALLRYNPDVHEAKLVLVYLYMRLCLTSLALNHFDSLNVKEIQYDTVGHAILMELSVTTAETKMKHNKHRDQIRKIMKGEEMYARHEVKLAETEAAVLSSGQVGLILDLHALRDNLRMSLTRRMYHLELRRDARLAGYALPKLTLQFYPRITATWIDFKDNRDFDATFDYGFNIERALHGFTHPKLWVLYQLAADTVWCLANNYPPVILDLDDLVKEISDTASRAHDALATDSQPEYLAGTIFHRMLQLLMLDEKAQKEHSKGVADDLKKLLSLLDRLNISTLVATPDPLCERLRDQYIYTDVLRLVVVFCKFVGEHMNPPPKAELSELQSQAECAFAQLQKHARMKAAMPFGANVRECLTGQDELREAIRQVGAQHAKSFSKAVVDSAKEGWEVLTKLKLT